MPNPEKMFTLLQALSLGQNYKGKPVLIVCALYGLKSSGAAWRAHLATTLTHLGYTSSLADPDVWFHAST